MLKRCALAFLLGTALVLLSVAGVLQAASATITGEVDNQFRIITSDGEIYIVADTEKGKEMVAENAGETVEAVGRVVYSEEEDLKTITVETYKVIAPDGIEEEE